MADRIATLLDSLSRPGIRSCRSPSGTHATISKRRADHDRVSKDELETELRLNGLANFGEQAKAARELTITEGALRHWRDRTMPRCLPPRWAVDELRARREKLWPSRMVVG